MNSMIAVANSETERGAFEARTANAILNLLNFGVIVANSEGRAHFGNRTDRLHRNFER